MQGAKKSGLFQELKKLVYVGTVGQPHAQLAAEFRAEFEKIAVRFGVNPSDSKVLNYFRSVWLNRPGAPCCLLSHQCP